MNSQLGCNLRGDVARLGGNGIFERSQFGSCSPDIVPLGVSELPDPSARLLAEFDADPSQTIVRGGVNQIFLRGVYSDRPDQSYTARMYHGDGSLIVWPETLLDRACTTGDGFTEIPLKPNYKGSKFSLTLPFLYNAPVREEPVSFFTEIYNPQPIAQPSPRWLDTRCRSLSDLASYAPLKLVNWASRNVDTVPTARSEHSFVSSFYSGSSDENLVFSIRCLSVPVGWTVSMDFKSDKTGEVESWIPPTKVADSQSFGVFTEKFIKAETAGETIVHYESNGVRPIPGWSITVDVMLVADPTSTSEIQSFKADQLLGDASSLANAEVTRVIPIGGGRIASPTLAGLQQPSLGYAQPVIY